MFMTKLHQSKRGDPVLFDFSWESLRNVFWVDRYLLPAEGWYLDTTSFSALGVFSKAYEDFPAMIFLLWICWVWIHLWATTSFFSKSWSYFYPVSLRDSEKGEFFSGVVNLGCDLSIKMSVLIFFRKRETLSLSWLASLTFL